MSDEQVMCPGCPHPIRQHGAEGCQRGECVCDLTPTDLEPKPAATGPDPLEVVLSDNVTVIRSLQWWDCWHCKFCLARYYTERECCDQQAIPVRVMVLPREVAA